MELGYLSMTDRTLKMTELLLKLNHNSLGHLTFQVGFNKTLRPSEVSKASKVRQVSQPVRAKQAWNGGPVQADCTV